MDRRRFTPSSEDLEGRQLLSLFGGKSQAQLQANQPVTVVQKAIRIERLPNLFQTVQNGRFVPKETVSRLQSDLQDIVGRLPKVPSQSTRVNFELTLRKVLSNASLSRESVQSLNHTFTQVMTSAGISEPALANLQTNMNDLMHADAQGVNPTSLAANDYAIVLETALAVGRPLRQPGAPRLQATDDSGVKGDGETSAVQPHLVGMYEASATIDIVDKNRQVLGTATSSANGMYVVRFAKPLAPGSYTVGVRATFGDIQSPVSPMITLKIVPKATLAVPQGPRSLARR
ncbi:MAG: Ig-like domain-containing protein [Isosphaeraceae bacterium]